ncbi:FAD-dependent oxidoreductase [Kribbella sp. NPDC026611]|uniref:FAD/NAD(P)-dependent oxidoreductase n=1 Tax=Kribbella sp. NPDC026611 TaxID=3154911 RepID=UPI0033CB6C92
MVVVGAGPAGIAAALAAADAGVEVVLVDSGRTVGGQFNRQLPVEFGARRPERLQHGWKSFVQQRERLAAHPRITHSPETSVWAIEGLRLWVQRGPADAAGRAVFPIDAKAVVLATGAYDRVLPFPGWDLPGVYTAGAAQALAKGQRVAVGKRVLVAGTGPFLLPVAESLIGVDAEVVGLLEANSLATVRRGWSTDPFVARSKLRETAGYAALLARHRIPLKHGWTVIAAHGNNHVESATIARLDADWHPIPGTERELEVDAICVGFGFTPNLELATATGCDLSGSAVVVDRNQQTTTPGVFAAGELTGIGGAELSSAEGQVAGLAAAGHVPTDRQFAAVERGRRFAAALAAAYPLRDGWMSWSDASTLVCRCEEVTKGDLESAVDARGVTDGRALRLTTRVGLGLCQGRVCSRNVCGLLGTEDAGTRRPIAVPVRLRDLAEAQEDM